MAIRSYWPSGSKRERGWRAILQERRGARSYRPATPLAPAAISSERSNVSTLTIVLRVQNGHLMDLNNLPRPMAGCVLSCAVLPIRKKEQNREQVPIHAQLD